MTSYTTKDIAVDGGALRVGIWGDGGPLVVAAHGITSAHQVWALIGPELGRDHLFVAPDLRGRGMSRDLPGPYGIAAHAADLAAVIAAFGGRAILVGHSMGGFVVVETVRRHPDLVSRLVLVDGGAPLQLPVGIDPSTDETRLGEAIGALVGAAYARLSMTFPSREAYREFWQAHPSFVDWSEAMATYADYDLVGTEPELRPACRLEAAVRDARDLYALPGVEPAALPVPAALLRAERGMMDEPDQPFYAPGYASRWLPGVTESTVEGTNHYTITLGPAGAAAVTAAVRA
jgi:pimeloyl-ACP methyl ester carboxylesterase